jgi:hypothetical protein
VEGTWSCAANGSSGILSFLCLLCGFRSDSYDLRISSLAMVDALVH